MHKKGKELNQLLDIYEKELCNHIFKYQLNYKIDIEIAFYKENHFVIYWDYSIFMERIGSILESMDMIKLRKIS